MPEEKLNQPIEIDEKLKASLPPQVREHLSKVKLHEAMTHKGGFGDYLDNYLDAIKAALKNNEPIPRINAIEDFMKFSDHKIDSYDYSNTGILFVGLAIQHAFNEYQLAHNLEQLDYHKILCKFVLNEAKIPNVSTHRPDNGRFNTAYEESPHIVGGPAGGYWTTTNDLARFGQWLYQKCLEPEFKRLIETYGREFYDLNTQMIAHAGALPSSSAFLSLSLKTGSVIAVCSDHGYDALTLKTAIERNIFAVSIEAKQDNVLDQTEKQSASSTARLLDRGIGSKEEVQQPTAATISTGSSVQKVDSYHKKEDIHDDHSSRATSSDNQSFNTNKKAPR